MLISHLPNILIVKIHRCKFFQIHLKRFNYQNGYLQKLDTPIFFPQKGLILEKWTDSIEEDDQKIYDLYGIINHYGNG